MYLFKTPPSYFQKNGPSHITAPHQKNRPTVAHFFSGGGPHCGPPLLGGAPLWAENMGGGPTVGHFGPQWHPSSCKSSSRVLCQNSSLFLLFSGCCPSVFCIISYIGGAHPLLNRQVGLFAKTTPSYGVKCTFFGVLPLNILYYFILPTSNPLVSREVGLFAKTPSINKVKMHL